MPKGLQKQDKDGKGGEEKKRQGKRSREQSEEIKNCKCCSRNNSCRIDGGLSLSLSFSLFISLSLFFLSNIYLFIYLFICLFIYLYNMHPTSPFSLLFVTYTQSFTPFSPSRRYRRCSQRNFEDNNSLWYMIIPMKG